MSLSVERLYLKLHRYVEAVFQSPFFYVELGELIVDF